MNKPLSFFILILFLYSCSLTKQIGKSAQQNVINSTALSNAHIGISVYEPATNKWWYNYQGDKYFVPASNTKLATCYAAMKYLGDSLVGANYFIEDGSLVFESAGDPTFLHPDFKNQPFYNFLVNNNFKSISIFTRFNAEPLGSGWAWNDYNETYMPERDPFPIYGNLATFTFKDTLAVITKTFQSNVISRPIKNKPWSVERLIGENGFIIDNEYGSTSSVKSVPIAMGKGLYASIFLSDTLHKKVSNYPFPLEKGKAINFHSQPTDTFLKITMHRSDNFFAEQSLLMVSNERLGFMSDAKIIDTLIKTDFKDLPQKPRWADGSGLSRYNLFSPQDFVTILNKMRTEFGMERIKNILATGNTGTLTNYYKADSTFIFAKTGTLSGVVALSGFLYTKQNKLLLFSVLVNNHNSSATEVRRTVEKFIEGIRNKY